MRPYLFLTLAVLTAGLNGDVVINEILASNSTIIQDVDQEYSDYIELYNSGSSSASMDGLYLTDDAAELTKWQLPAIDLAAGEYLLIYASGKDTPKDLVQAHMWFNLASAAGLREAAGRRDQIAEQMTQDELTVAERQAIEWRPKE